MDKAWRFLMEAFICATVLGGVHSSRAAVLLQIPSGKQPAVEPSQTCTPQKAVVKAGEIIEVKLWLAAGSNPQQPKWTASGGHIEGNEATAVWDFANVEPGFYTAGVQFTGSSGPATCSVNVVVQEALDERGARRESGHELLVKGSDEAKGYGLYSYVLLGAAPDSSSRDRALNVIQAVLQQSSAITDLEQYFDRKQLNITYIPVISSGTSSPTPEWILNNYDYARARFLIHSLSEDFGPGPYIVSSTRPLSGAGSYSGPRLKQDFSSVPPHLVSMWTAEFLNQAAQEHFWEEDHGRRLFLHLRTAIGIMAEGLPDVRKGLSEWISFTH